MKTYLQIGSYASPYCDPVLEYKVSSAPWIEVERQMLGDPCCVCGLPVSAHAMYVRHNEGRVVYGPFVNAVCRAWEVIL